MNPKKTKRRKHAQFGSKTEEGKAEVFVLPPDLLQKLGINLANVTCTQENKTDATSLSGGLDPRGVPNNSLLNEEVPRCAPQSLLEKDTTILKTADLMKKSVFLSPTFATIDNNVNVGELEISSVDDPETNQNKRISEISSIPDPESKKIEGVLKISSYIDSDINKNDSVLKKSSIADLERNKNKSVSVISSVADPETNQNGRASGISSIPDPESNKIESVLKVSSYIDSDINKNESVLKISSIADLERNKNKSVSVISSVVDPETNFNDCSLVNNTGFDYHPTVISEPFTSNQQFTFQIEKLPVVEEKQSIENNADKRDDKTNCESDPERSNTPDSNFTSVSSQDSDQIVMTANYEIAVTAESIDEHLDEAYLSDCSNSNSGPDNGDAFNNFSRICATQTTERENKVHIISEEVLSPSKLRELKILFSPKRSDLIPVPISSLLKSGNFNEHCELSKENMNKAAKLNLKNLDGSMPVNNSSMLNGVAHANVKNGKINSSAISDLNIRNFDITDRQPNEYVHNNLKPVVETPENTFGDVDLVVIGMEIEENEDILHTFANEITSNDDNKIFDIIEETEKGCEFNSRVDSEALEMITDTSEELQNDKKDDFASIDAVTDFSILCPNIRNNQQNCINKNDRLNLKNTTEYPDSKASECVSNSKLIEPNTTDIVQSSMSIPNDKSENVKGSKEYTHDFMVCNGGPYGMDCVSEIDKGIKYNMQKHEKTIQEIYLECIQKNSTSIVTNINANNTCVREKSKIIDSDSIGAESKATKSLLGAVKLLQGSNSPTRNCRTAEMADDFVKHNEELESKNHVEVIQVVTNDSKDQYFHNESVINGTTNDGKSCHNTVEDINIFTINECEKKVKTLNEKSPNIIKNNDSIEFCKNQESRRKCGKTNIIDKQNIEHKIPVDKVQEIAMYLNQFAKNHSRSIIVRRDSDKRLENPVKFIQKQNPLTSKKYIQGVEKPGGPEQTYGCRKTNRALKTYNKTSKKHNRPYSSSTPVPLISTKEFQKALHEVVDIIEYKCVATAEETKKAEFCLCHDFGSLQYYGTKHPYEHIHFWDRTTVDCEQTDVFKIYDDDGKYCPNFDFEDDPAPEKDQGPSLDVLVDSICWNSFKYEPIAKQNDEKCNDIIQIKCDTTVEDSFPKIYTGGEQNKQDNKSRILGNTCTFQFDNFDSTRTSTSSQSMDFALVEANKFPEPNKETVVDGQLPSSSNIKNCCQESTVKGFLHKNELIGPKHTVEIVSTDNQCAVIETNIQSFAPDDCVYNEDYAVQGTKRQLSQALGSDDSELHEAVTQNSIQCGVCNEVLSKSQWDDHVANKHCFIAWKSGDSFDFEDSNLFQKLQQRFTCLLRLICTFCQTTLVRPKHFLEHVKMCFKKFEDHNKSETVKPKVKNSINTQNIMGNADGSVTSGVYSAALNESELEQLRADKHGYLARTEGARAPKRRLSKLQSMEDHSQIAVEENDEPVPKKSVQCGVCNEVMSESNWKDHVETQHCFIAWKSGDSFDFNDLHLFVKLRMVKNMRSFECTFCNAEYVQPTAYLKHVEKCFRTLKEQTRTEEEKIAVDRPKVNVDKSLIYNTTIDRPIEENLQTSGKKSSDYSHTECGVCKESVLQDKWIEHIQQKHDYIAWKKGEIPVALNDQDSIRIHLFNVVKRIGQLKCSKCGSKRKYPKSFMQHIKHCGTGNVNRNPNTSIKQEGEDSSVNCGVCSAAVNKTEWEQHRAEKHGYLAWIEGEPALNIDDDCAVREFLYRICKKKGSLVCNKCGCVRKYVKSYCNHIENCTGPTIITPQKSFVNPLVRNSVDAPIIVKKEKEAVSSDDDTKLSKLMVKCGACSKKVWSEKWIQHISRTHQYMAWKEGETFDVNNEEEVYDHLYKIIRKVGYLVCSKCGVVRKQVNKYLQHVENCEKEASIENYDDNSETQVADGKLTCALCSEEMEPKKWNKHKMEKHYNVAWTVGSIPVDYRNSNVVDTLLKEYVAKFKKLICRVCGASRVSRVGFYAHVIACGKTEEEINVHKNLCSICNKKYLAIYHNQHMTWHVQQEFNKEKKRLKEEEDKEDLLKNIAALKEEQNTDVTPGRRRAAQKARNIIEQIKSEKFAFTCPKCNFGFDTNDELIEHVCKLKVERDDDDDLSDSEESVKLDDVSGEETDDSDDLDENVSDDEREVHVVKKKKSKRPTYSHERFPYVPKNLENFLTLSSAEFHIQHLTSDSLFPGLRAIDCELVPKVQLHEYLPLLEKSCKVKFCDNTWKEYKRFEAEIKKYPRPKHTYTVVCQSFFTGACIQCISWAPPASDVKNSGGNYLAVACHRGSDTTRITSDVTYTHPGLIQLWGFGDFKEVCKLVMGIAHDYGIVWAMDWCPSGARDVLPDQLKPGDVYRLGLLAVATSSGYTYIYSVPYPSTLEQREHLIRRLKPVAELRLTINPDRKMYQATSVCWSMKKPYDSIAVGYADGTVAYFDLNTDSPLLKTVENGVTIVYPYHDDRPHSSCVTGVSLYPSVGACEAACSSSLTGAALTARPAVRPARSLLHSAVAGCLFQPLWPSAALVGDDANMSMSLNEVEWCGGGRRLGGGAAGAGCRHCGRLVTAALPLLRARVPHPADLAANKQTLGVLQMAPLTKKRSKLANDELQTIVEPTTYEDAIRKYGIELRTDKDSINKTIQKPREFCPERFPERFPLSDVPAMAFCPEGVHHRRLAVATHAGLIFLLQV